MVKELSETQRVGREIRDLRKAKGMTLSQLVKVSGLSMGFLSQVETGRGVLDLWIGDIHVRLEAGDSFAFESTTPHRYANPTDEEIVVIWAITPPSY